MWWVSLLILFLILPVPTIIIGLCILVYKIFAKTLGD